MKKVRALTLSMLLMLTCMTVTSSAAEEGHIHVKYQIIQLIVFIS